MQHLPLSQSLAKIVEANSRPEGITLNTLLVGTEGRGLYLVIIILSLPFIVPVSIPGFSTVLGLMVALLSFRLALGKPPELPRFMGRRKLPHSLEKRVLGGGIKFLRLIEKFVKPRRTPWMTSRYARFGNASVMTIMGLLLALPFPPLPPLTNSLPSYTIILLAASMMEEDGVTIWVSYVVAIGTVIYLVLVVGGLEMGVMKVYHLIQEHLAQ